MVPPSQDTIQKANLLPVYFARNIHFTGISIKNQLVCFNKSRVINTKFCSVFSLIRGVHWSSN